MFAGSALRRFFQRFLLHFLDARRPSPLANIAQSTRCFCTPIVFVVEEEIKKNEGEYEAAATVVRWYGCDM